MKQQFKEFTDNIRLSAQQIEDAKVKYDGVAKKLHDAYYDTTYNGTTKILFGSYRTKTNTSPITSDQDVDLLFKIPEDVYIKFKNYETNGASALLQEIRDILKEKYTTTENISAWGKVVKIAFSDSSHNIELLPAFEQEDGTFIIPNSTDEGSWEIFDPRKQLEDFFESNNNTNGLTADLTRMLKTWVKYTSTCNYKSFHLLIDIIDFLNYNYEEGVEVKDYPQVIKSFLESINDTKNESLNSHITTAFNRVNKAIDLEKNNKYIEASEEWQKIFGTKFPKAKENPVTENSNPRVFSNPTPAYANNFTF